MTADVARGRRSGYKRDRIVGRDGDITLTCPAGEPDRLDRMVARLLPATTRGAARRLIADGRVFVDGRRCRVASRTVRAGTALRIAAAAAATNATSATPRDLPILHEDDDLVAVDKPAGMPAAPTRTAAAGTALTTLERQLTARDGRPVRLFVVHRLDAGTSGVLLFAKTRVAAAALGGAFADGRAEKEYLARVAKAPGAARGSIDLALAADGRRARVAANGRPARTDWEVVDRDPRGALLRLSPRTGRMHQIRVHLQASGHPILGDRAYGGPPAPRLMLHAARLVVPHPGSGAPLMIASLSTI